MCNYTVSNCHLHDDRSNTGFAFFGPWVKVDYYYDDFSLLELYAMKTFSNLNDFDFKAGETKKFHLHCDFHDGSGDTRLPTNFDIDFIDTCLNTEIEEWPFLTDMGLKVGETLTQSFPYFQDSELLNGFLCGSKEHTLVPNNYTFITLTFNQTTVEFELKVDAHSEALVGTYQM